MTATGLAGKRDRLRRDTSTSIAARAAFDAAWEAARPHTWRLASAAVRTPLMTGSRAARSVGLAAFPRRFRAPDLPVSIAINVALRHNEQQRRRSHVTESLDAVAAETRAVDPTKTERDSDPEVCLMAAERMPRIRAAVDALPDDLRTPLIMDVYEEMKYREIAELLEIPIGTVMSHVHAARQRLRAALPEEFSPE